jgi:hypothetical protein
MAYPGPIDKDVVVGSSQQNCQLQRNSVTIESVVKGFCDLGKDMSSSELLTMLLRALAKDEIADLFEWLLWETFKHNPPADGMGHW